MEREGTRFPIRLAASERKRERVRGYLDNFPAGQVLASLILGVGTLHDLRYFCPAQDLVGLVGEEELIDQFSDLAGEVEQHAGVCTWIWCHTLEFGLNIAIR
jgi:hypothetical protein